MMKKIREGLRTVVHWGINAQMQPSMQRKVMLSNQIALILILMATTMMIIFTSQGLYVHLIFSQANLLLLGSVLLLNRLGYIYVSQFILSVVPPLSMTCMSVYTKMNGHGATLVFVLAPRMILSLMMVLPVILFGHHRNRYMILSLIPGLLCIFLFEEIHTFFNIRIYTFPWGNHGLLKIVFLNTALLLIMIVYALQNTNQYFEQRVNKLLKETEEKNEELAIQNEIIAQSNKHITDSINYAKRIQQAILGNPAEVTRHFEDAFIFFQPKDIVSGDFYWFCEIDNHGQPLKILIAADCTGHGVPGAFMTVMGNDLLNEIVNNQHITDPAEILYALDRRVLSTFQKQNADRQTNDGMDMTILVIDENSGKARFAGAKNPLYFIQNGEIREIKGSKFPIGSAQFKVEKVFTTHEINLREASTFYLFSDGFQDQFGGANNQKYMTKHFRNFLHSIAHLPMQQQHDRLRAELTRWKQGQLQTDDVLVVGIRNPAGGHP